MGKFDVKRPKYSHRVVTSLDGSCSRTLRIVNHILIYILRLAWVYFLHFRGSFLVQIAHNLFCNIALKIYITSKPLFAQLVRARY